MNIFVAGVHGVGKTYLAARAAAAAGLSHTSASKLIKEELALPIWANDKRVTDVDANQRALVAAIRRYNGFGTRLLLDGHFVLLGEADEMIRLEVDVFAALRLNGVILVETDPLTVAQRIADRDKRQVSIEYLQAFMYAERDQAQMVCAQLNTPLILLVSPLPEEFAASVASLNPNCI